MPFEKKIFRFGTKDSEITSLLCITLLALGPIEAGRRDVGDLFAFRMSDGKSTKALYLVLKALLLMEEIPNNHRLDV